MQPRTTPIVEMASVVKKYGERTILDGIDISINPGEIVCFIGPSGTGKSTLLRCINGLEDIQGGIIHFQGEEVDAHSRRIRAVRKRIGMIFQHFNLYPHLTALENVMLAPIVVMKEDKKVVERRARALFEKVRLSHRINAYPGQLSGGEQQRVAIARALCVDPSLLMFDEPTSALDPETVGDVLAAMRALAEEGRTMLVVTHEIRFAVEVGTRMVFMDGGKIVEQGPPKELMANPATERARQFLSSIRH
jgi:ABC-type polar amino acid transport system ATPase subunit